MKKGKLRVLWLVLALIVTLPSIPAAADSADNAITLSPYQGDTSKHFQSSFTYYNEIRAMLIGEPTTGKILIEKNSDEPLGIASMTKLMTCYIVKKDIRDGKLDAKKVVTVTPEAAAFNAQSSSNYGLQVGEKLTVERLLMGMMVVSGNDAATMLGQVVGGNEVNFAKRMNAEAQALGMKKTHFVNASGFTVNGKYNTSTARDMFLLASTLIREFPEVQDWAKIKTVDEPERKYKGKSTLTEATVAIPGMTGLKTGVTDEAGYCFTGSFALKSSVDGGAFEAVTVVMGTKSNDARWRTTKELVDLAAGTFSHVPLVDAAKPVKRYAIPSAEEESIVLYPAKSFSVFTYTNQNFDVRYKIDETIKAPTAAEAKFGEISVYRDGKLIKIIDIVSHKPTRKAGLWTRLTRATSDFVRFLSNLF